MIAVLTLSIARSQGWKYRGDQGGYFMTINKKFQIITGLSLIRTIIFFLGLAVVFYIEWISKIFPLTSI